MTTRVNFASKRKTIKVEIEELGETITLRALGVGQIIADSKSEDPNAPYRRLASSIIGDDGKLQFNAENEADIQELKEMSPTVFKQLMESLNALHDTETKIEDIKKNSEATPISSSASA